jgi:hypothetical protein
MSEGGRPVEINKVIKQIDADQLHEFLSAKRDKVKRELGEMQVDRLLRAYFADMKADGKDKPTAVAYLEATQRWYAKERKRAIVLDVMVKRGRNQIKGGK